MDAAMDGDYDLRKFGASMMRASEKDATQRPDKDMQFNIEHARLQVSQNTDASKKAALGQFLTPAATAHFMAGLFPVINGHCRLLDAGAGIGALSCAFLEQHATPGQKCTAINVVAFETDETLHYLLRASLSQFSERPHYTWQVQGGDFIEAAANLIQFGKPDFTHAILNPPYRKIASTSRTRLLLREVGIETVNLYSAFVALAIKLLRPGGQLVAIIPRSFCNGPYYRPFRDLLLAETALKHIHLFASRCQAFKDDSVLQENVIFFVERGAMQGDVVISTSTDDTFSDIHTARHRFTEIVSPADPERFIHIPTNEAQDKLQTLKRVRSTLSELGLQVSTGPVVDFRLKHLIRQQPESGDVPLLYPVHIRSNGTIWPLPDSKKPNAILCNDESRRWLFPAGHYCVVRRFSAKEERRRVIAGVISPSDTPGHNLIAFENHLNVFHAGKQGISEKTARGLGIYLNSSVVDDHFRRFNGHTQVNATDLRTLRYPSLVLLDELGAWSLSQSGEPNQQSIDAEIERCLSQ